MFVIPEGTPHTALHVIKTLSSALGAAVDDGRTPANPLYRVKCLPVMREPRRSLSAEQAERIRADMPSRRDGVLWGLIYCAGPRTEDALPVRWSDTPINLHNWRARIVNPAAERAGVGWAVPYAGRTTYSSLQNHAGLSPVRVAALAGNWPDIIWKHYAREFERSKTTGLISLGGGPSARLVGRSPTTVFARCSQETNVIELRHRA